jgi:hypothetical protein
MLDFFFADYSVIKCSSSDMADQSSKDDQYQLISSSNKSAHKSAHWYPDKRNVLQKRGSNETL